MKTILVCTVCSGFLASAVIGEGEKCRDLEVRGEKGSAQSKVQGARRGGKARDKMFKQMDSNQDGQISKTEFFSVDMTEKIPKERRDELYERLDRDGDGLISRKEIETMRRSHKNKRRREFRRLDTDRNRGLSYAEFSKGKFFSKLPEENRKEIFSKMDKDGDGEITLRDLPKHPRPPRGKKD